MFVGKKINSVCIVRIGILLLKRTLAARAHHTALAPSSRVNYSTEFALVTGVIGRPGPDEYATELKLMNFLDSSGCRINNK